ncbi:MAG: beta-N-acetylhexosaminidase [Spirochaetales bacterium]
MLKQPNLLPAPREFVASAGILDPRTLTVSESLVPQLGFEPQFVRAEAYEITLSPGVAELKALHPLGLGHARTTWAQLATQPSIPAGVIRDEPRFSWRGLMLDCARHFFPVPTILALLDRLASLKLNRFHWHLVDDQGWRLEIPGLPRLTELSAGGYYSTADVQTVVAYAQSRGITVVPEIELPGHSGSAIAAYPKFSCTGQPLEMPTSWGILPHVYCASSEKAASMLETILQETCRLFPGPWVHIGGDEVVRAAWEVCPRCQAKIRAEGWDQNGADGVLALEAAFFRRMIAFLASHGKTAVGWNEMFEHEIPRSAVVQWWHRPDLAQRSLEAGNPLLSSSTEFCYFDYPYTNHDSWYEPRYMKLTPVATVYANPVVPPGCESLMAGIQGGEACLWTEHVSPEVLGERLDGRLEALAEVYWSFDRRPGYDSFLSRAGALGLIRPTWQVPPLSQSAAAE